MPKINSLRKGKEGELEFSKFLQKEFGISARRGCQFSGGPDSPDIICDLIDIHWEVKRVEKLNFHEGLAQAIKDANGKKCPILATRKNGGEWVFVLRAVDARRFARSFGDVSDDQPPASDPGGGHKTGD